MDNNKGSKGSPVNDPRALMEQYQRSLAEVEYDDGRTERIIRQIKEKNRRRGQSIWTEDPVLKPEKSVWIDENSEEPTKQMPKQSTQRAASSQQRYKRRPEPEKSISADDLLMSVRVASEHNAEQAASKQREEKKNARSDRKLIDKSKTSLTMEVSENGSSTIRSSGKQTVKINMGAARPQAEPKPVYEEPKPAETAAQAAEPVNAVKEAAQAADQSDAKSAELQKELLPFLSAPDKEPVRREEPKAAAKESVSEGGSKAPFEAATVEITEKDYESDLEKYERLREKTLKKQKERERLSKNGRNDFEFSFVNAAVCLTVMFCIAIALVVMKRESGFINSENRNLATFPKFSISSWFKGDFAKGVTEYYTDTIPYREEIKKAAAKLRDYTGIKSDVTVKGKLKTVKKEKLDEEKVAQTTTVTAFTGKVTTTTTQKGETTTTTTTKKTEKEEVVEVPDNMDDVNWEGNVIVVGSGKNVRAVDAYYGSFDIGEQYAEVINKWKADLGDTVNVYNMTIPTASAYYLPEKFQENVSDQKDNIVNIDANLKGVIGVEIYDTLDDHKKEYIYSRTDHHWQPLGAYYAMKVFAEKAGIDYPELSTYDEWKIENFVGTMYAYSDYDPQIAANPDTFIYYKPDNEYKVTYYDTSFQNPNTNDGLFFDYAEGVNCYSAILNVDSEIAEIETDCDNGRTLVIFKDSFGNATVPFLTHGFSKIYVCDFRYFDINAIDFCKQVGCTDLLFAISITSASTDFKIDQLNNIRIQ